MNNNDEYLDDTFINEKPSIERILGLEETESFTYKEDLNRSDAKSKNDVLLEITEEFLDDKDKN